MKKKICPICDQIMSSDHYCRGCHRWIWHPYERDMDFYLNERHPSEETHCDYHTANQRQQQIRQADSISGRPDIYEDQDLNRQLDYNRNIQRQNQPLPHRQNQTSPLPQRQGQIPPPQRQTQAPPPRQAPPQADLQGRRQNYMPGNTNQGASGSSANHSSGSRSNALAIILVVAFILVALLGTGVYTISNFVIQNNNSYDDIFDYGFDDYESSDNYRELEDEEVKAAGVNCNSFNHFKMRNEEIEPALTEALDSTGYRIASVSDASYNEASLEGDEEWTYYSTDHTLYVVGQNDMIIRDDWSQWVAIDYDTATGQIHSYSTQLKDQTKSIMLLTEFLRGIESAYEISEVRSCVPMVTRDMQISLQNDGVYYFESYWFHITGEVYGDGLSIYVYCNQED